ncbi:MAG: GNAT family N-acetyltransferase, partial [Bacteroidales bacterium]|nr:GNAT family N-acetyltransferase [Bacteroidales bacterium]
NLQKGKAHPFEFKDIPIEEYLDFKYSAVERVPVGRDYLGKLFMGLAGTKRAEAFGLFLDGDLQAVAILGYARTRAIYMNGCSTPAGKETRAMFVLMDRLIERTRGKFPVFDFEGSNLPGVARFFEGFGGRKTLYPRIVRTKFPLFRWKG